MTKLSGPVNDVQLEATIESMGAERYTPAGVLALDLVLKHESEQTESDVLRHVGLSIKAVAFDEMAYRLRSVNMQTSYLFKGFLASRGRTKQVVLHVTDFQPMY